MKKYLCGVDLGGTKLSAGLFLPNGSLIEKLKIHDHAHQTNDEITQTIIELIKKLLCQNHVSDEELYGIGIGVAGHINFKKGIIIASSNFSHNFCNYPLRSRIESAFNTQIVLDNDANVQAYGEFRFGAGRGFSDIIFVTISTGIGGGLIIDEKLLRGITGTAGEIGHTIVDPNSDIKCSCGNYGCLMSLSSGFYLPRLYEHYLKKGMPSKLGLTLTTVDILDGILLEKGLDIDDPISMQVLEDSANTVGMGLYNLFQIVNPEIFILGGGLMNLGDRYLNPIKKQFYSLVKNMMYDEVLFSYAKLGDNAGLLGAAALTLEGI